MSQRADVVVVGAGAAGLAAAYAARGRGASVILIERQRLGGECTWKGCVPSKTLLEIARRVHAGRRVGLTGDPDFGAVMEHVDDVVLTVSQDEDHAALRARGITVFDGQATFTGDRRLSVDGTAVHAPVVVLATGTTPLLPPVDGLDAVPLLTNDSVFDLRALPRRLAVLGGGPIALELGQAFQRLSSQVTILQRAPRLAAKEEPEASEALLTVLRREGVRVELGTDVAQVRQGSDGAVCLRAGEMTVEADALLVATGRTAQTDGLEPDAGGVALDDKGYITVDEHLATTAEGVWAVGDVIGGPQFTHAGYDMGTLAIGNAHARHPRLRRRFSTRALPWATYTEPEVGRVGMTEAQAYAEYGSAAQVAFLPIDQTDRAKCTGDVDGFVKLVAGPKRLTRNLAGGQLIGATVVCPTGGDVVHELALAVRTGAFTGRLAQTVHAYPSWSLAVREAATLFFTSYKGLRARPARPG